MFHTFYFSFFFDEQFSNTFLSYSDGLFGEVNKLMTIFLIRLSNTGVAEAVSISPWHRDHGVTYLATRESSQARRQKSQKDEAVQQVDDTTTIKMV